MNKYIISIITLSAVFALTSCNKKEEDSKSNIQILADKEKELNDREAKIKLKEIELEEREKKLNIIEHPGNNITDTSKSSMNLQDTAKIKEKEKTKNEKKKEIQKEISKKFENPSVTVRDYFEYIQRGINESGNFDANMSKAQKLFPSRTVDKLKGSYKKTKQFSVVEEPKVLNQKDNNATVTTKVKQVEIINKDGKDQEVTKTMSVTYSLKANNLGQWVITGAQVKNE